jgi:hypothetical protein
MDVLQGTVKKFENPVNPDILHRGTERRIQCGYRKLGVIHRGFSIKKYGKHSRMADCY